MSVVGLAMDDSEEDFTVQNTDEDEIEDCKECKGNGWTYNNGFVEVCECQLGEENG